MIAGESEGEVNGVAFADSVLFALADERAKVFWHALSEPIATSVRKLPWTRHSRGIVPAFCTRHG
jgi:hypothetical protein